MIVVAHGDVTEYCAAHGMTIGERYVGKLEEYSGRGLILVTDNCADVNDYYYLRGIFRSRGIELVSTHWYNPVIENFMDYKEKRDAGRRVKRGGRRLFGLRNDAEMAIVRKIFELRDAGKTMREIAADPVVRYLDGRKIPVSSIQVILKNRGRYDEL